MGSISPRGGSQIHFCDEATNSTNSTLLQEAISDDLLSTSQSVLPGYSWAETNTRQEGHAKGCANVDEAQVTPVDFVPVPELPIDMGAHTLDAVYVTKVGQK